MKAKPKKPKAAPAAADLTPLSPEETALVETWLTASRAEKAAARIKKNFEPAMLALIKSKRMINASAAVIRLGESVSYEYPSEVEALDDLVKALKKEAKKDGTAAMETEANVTVDDFQQYVDPPAVAESKVLHGLKAWLMGLIKRD